MLFLRDKNEVESLESALPAWKRSFLPPSTEVQDVLIRIHNAEKVSAVLTIKYFCCN